MINNQTRLSIPRYKLIISKFLGLFQTVQMDELIDRDHVSVAMVVQITIQLITILHELGISCPSARFK